LLGSLFGRALHATLRVRHVRVENIEGNQIVNNTVGVFLNMEKPFDVSQASNQIHGNREADVRKGAAEAVATGTGGQP